MSGSRTLARRKGVRASRCRRFKVTVLLTKLLFRLEKTLHKYRERYSELMDKLKSSLKENEKMKISLQQTQEKHDRRILEMKEVRKFVFFMFVKLLKIAEIVV